MAISSNNERMIVTLPKELKEAFINICKKEKRTTSKQLEVILEKFIQDYNK